MKNNLNQRVSEKIADGWNRKANPALEKKYIKELTELWQRSVRENKPELFFPEKRKFFYACPDALEVWIKAVAQEHVIEDGFCPQELEGRFSLQTDTQYWWWRMSKYSMLEDDFYENKARIDPWEGIHR